MTKIITTIAFILSFVRAEAQIWTPPQGIRTIPIANLPDIATASLDNLGPVIYFNPTFCQQAGPLATGFFMAHEYGHHYLGHVINQANPYAQVWLTFNAENQADEYALRYWISQGNTDVIRSGLDFLWSVNNSGDYTHPPSRQRANRLMILYQTITGRPLYQ